MPNLNYVLTHPKQRKLTIEQACFLLAEYVASEKTTYAALSKKYGVSEGAVSRIVRNFTYRDLPNVAHLREQAQKKAAARCAQYSTAKSVRVPDPRLTVIEVDCTSIESAYAALWRIQNMCSQLVGAAEEGSHD